MSMSVSYTLLNKKFSEEGVGLCEKMGLQPISEVLRTEAKVKNKKEEKLEV